MSGIYKHASYEFKIIKKIGSGGFGQVFEASLPTCDHTFALKVFSPSPSTANATCFTHQELLNRFTSEINEQSKCQHENIVPIRVFHNSSSPFFVMDLAEKDLAKILELGNIRRDEQIKIVSHVMSGLEYLHDNQLLHRDIKPANILKFGDTYKISDFGLIKSIDPYKNKQQVMTAIGYALGTENYMAPEVIEACDYSIRSDIYALGRVIDQLQILGFEPIVDKCTMLRPNARYQSVAELRADILKVV